MVGILWAELNNSVLSVITDIDVKVPFSKTLSA